MENKVVLYGASGHCKVIIDILQSNSISIEMIVDDNDSIKSILNIKVLHSTQLNETKKRSFIISIGNNKVRKVLSKRLNTNFINAIHHRAIVSNAVSMGVGNVVMAGAIINPDAKINNHCIINTSAVIEHDCLIEDFVHISPSVSLAGNVTVGEGTHVGIGASVIQGVKIGKWATIGAGSVIIRDVPDYAVVVGNPGKIIKYIEHE